MFIPFATDAPLYHRPFATIGLIVVNVLLYIAQFDSDMDGWQLQLGNGLHPVEWWTSAFYHYGIIHLIGNMIFLWTFGLIVEGKLGWWRFLGLYFAMAGVEGAITQVLMLASEIPSTAGGASGVIYALMAISLIWAPRNEIDVLLIFGFGLWIRSFVFQVSVMAFSAFYIGLDLILAALRGFRMSSEVLHVLGAAIGFPAACLMLKWNLVDCEGWDAFTLWRGRTLVDEIAGPAVLRGPRANPDAEDALPRRKRASVQRTLEQLDKALETRNPLAAWSAYQILRERGKQERIERSTHRRLIDALRGGKDWDSLRIVLEDYVSRFPGDSDRPRLILAELLSRREQRPRAALRALEPIEQSRITPQERSFARKITRLCQTQIDDGVVELSGPS